MRETRFGIRDETTLLWDELTADEIKTLFSLIDLDDESVCKCYSNWEKEISIIALKLHSLEDFPDDFLKSWR